MVWEFSNLLVMIDDEEIPDKSKVQYEHLKRVKEHMAAEEEAAKAARVIKGADTKNYKKFKDGYVPPPEQELSDEMKLKLTRAYQALAGFIGVVSIGITFFLEFHSPLYFSIFENFVIIFNIYNSKLYLAIFENYLVIKINLIVLGFALVAASIAEIINFQRKHDKISDRIMTGRSHRPGPKRVSRKYQGLIRVMGIAGVGIILLSIYFSRQHIPILENFAIVLSITDSTLNISIFESIIVKTNLILLGCALVISSVGIIGFRHRHR